MFFEIRSESGPSRRMAMRKKYVVRLTKQERQILRDVIRGLKGSSMKVRRAQILLKCDADGPNWTDQRVAEAFGCRTKTVENIRQRLVTEGFEETLHAKKPELPPRSKVLDGAQEAQVIALRLLADKVVELGIVEKVSHETLRKTLKKMA